jgi:zinc/manganese transport system permease protein
VATISSCPETPHTTPQEILRACQVSNLGLLFLLVLVLTVTGAAQVASTVLVLSLAITPGAAAQRLTASPLAVARLSIVFAIAAADGGLLISFEITIVKASVFITSISFAIYVLARVAGPALRRRRPEPSSSTPGGSPEWTTRSRGPVRPDPAGNPIARALGSGRGLQPGDVDAGA